MPGMPSPWEEPAGGLENRAGKGQVRLRPYVPWLLSQHACILRWKYSLILAIDANFRLKLKNRAIKDVYLNRGWAYGVDKAPFEKLIATVPVQSEVSSPFISLDVY